LYRFIQFFRASSFFVSTFPSNFNSLSLLSLFISFAFSSPSPQLEPQTGLPLERLDRNAVHDPAELVKRGFNFASIFSDQWSGDSSATSASSTSDKTSSDASNSSSGSSSDATALDSDEKGLAFTIPEAQNKKNIPGNTSGNGQLPSPGTKEYHDFISQLKQADTAIDRNNLLGPAGLAFSFLESASFGGGGKDGGVVLADNTQYPATVGNGLAMLAGFLGPCGMVAPHTHPRATEVLVLISGPPLTFGMIPEGGTFSFSGVQLPGTVALLPQGSYHFVQNSGCTPSVIVAGFNNESPGAQFLGNSYAAFDASYYAAAFGENVTVLDADKIPNAVNIGTKSCMQKCSLDASTFDILNYTKQEIMLESYATYLESVGYNW